MSDEPINVPKELAEAEGRLAVDLSQREMPLDMTIRAMALTIAQRHCGDTTIKEGNLYQQLKMDNKLAGPLTTEHVIYAALIFERYLWGEWSKGVAGKAMEATLAEVKASLEEEFKDEPPTRPHGGGANE